MNILLILVVVFFSTCTFLGWKRGLFKTLFSCGASILAIIITINCSHYVGKALNEYTTLNDTIQKQIVSSLQIDPQKEEDVVRVDQTESIENLKLPESIKKGLIENNNKEIYSALNATGFYEYISKYLAGIIINGISFLATFLLVGILVRLLLKLMDFVTQLPILNGLNRIGGLLLGMVQGLVIVWIFFILVTVFSTTGIGQTIYMQINDSMVLAVLYNNNLLLEFMTNMSKLLF